MEVDEIVAAAVEEQMQVIQMIGRYSKRIVGLTAVLDTSIAVVVVKMSWIGKVMRIDLVGKVRMIGRHSPDIFTGLSARLR